MSVARALFLTLILLNYERWTRLVMVLGAPWGPWAVSTLRRPCSGVCMWLRGGGRAGAQTSPYHEGAVPAEPQLLRPHPVGSVCSPSGDPLCCCLWGRSRLCVIKTMDPVAGLLVQVSPDRKWLGGCGFASWIFFPKAEK